LDIRNDPDVIRIAARPLIGNRSVLLIEIPEVTLKVEKTQERAD
jgi:hypothetical protein